MQCPLFHIYKLLPRGRFCFNDSWSPHILIMWMMVSMLWNIIQICICFSSIELKSGWNHPNLDVLHHPNLDDSVSHLKMYVLYNPFSDDSEYVLMLSKSGCFVQSIFGWLCSFQKWIFSIILIWMILYMLVSHPKLDVLYNPNLYNSKWVSMSSKSGSFAQSIFGWLCIFQDWLFCTTVVVDVVPALVVVLNV